MSIQFLLRQIKLGYETGYGTIDAGGYKTGYETAIAGDDFETKSLKSGMKPGEKPCFPHPPSACTNCHGWNSCGALTTYIHVDASLPLPSLWAGRRGGSAVFLRRTKGVPRNGGRKLTLTTFL